jgi:hypothetical protein
MQAQMSALAERSAVAWLSGKVKAILQYQTSYGDALGPRKGSRGGCLLTAKFHKKTIKNKIISKDYL